MFRNTQMSHVAHAAAKIFVKLCEDINYKNIFAESCEPYRAIVDLSRTTHIHNVIDGSEEYVQLVDLLETLVCSK